MLEPSAVPPADKLWHRGQYGNALAARRIRVCRHPCRERDQVNSSAPRLHVIDVVIQGESCQRVEQLFDALRGTSLNELREPLIVASGIRMS